MRIQVRIDFMQRETQSMSQQDDEMDARAAAKQHFLH